MSFSRMKPLPKFLIIALGVGAVVYGASFVIGKLPAKAPETKAEPVVTTTVPAESATPAASVSTPAAPPVAAAPAPAPAPVLQPATPSDAGLANVLGSTKK
jgi:hypothetical protein